MPFLFLGVVIFLLGVFMFRLGKKGHNHDFELGSIGLIIGGIILMILYGLFYRGLTLFGPQ
ncbi:hypothetical protein EBS80_01610 [bacterium]|nr:hypothetical protein [bacterium]